MKGIIMISMMAFICSLESVECRPHDEARTGYKTIRERLNEEEFQKRYFSHPIEDDGVRLRRNNVGGYRHEMSQNDAKKYGNGNLHPVLEDTVSNFFATLATSLARSITPKDGFVSPGVYDPFQQL